MPDAVNQPSPQPDSPALAGCRIILTRPAAEAEEMAAALQAAGAQVDKAPVIEFTSFIEQNLEPISRILEELRDRRGWLVLPSPTAIRHFVEVLSRIHLDPAMPNALRVATIGRAGVDQLHKSGIEVDFVSPEPRSASLAATLPVEANTPVIIAGSSQTRPELSAGLEARGAKVQVLPLYAPKPNPAGLKQLSALLERHALERSTLPSGAPLDFLCVTSPSVVDAIADAFDVRHEGLPALLADKGWISIGPTTQRHLISRGFPTLRCIQAPDPSAAGILQAAAELVARLAAGREGPPA